MVLLPQRVRGWQERQGARCPGGAQKRSLLKEAPAQSAFSLRGVQGGTSLLENVRLQPKGRDPTQRAAASRLLITLCDSWKMICGGEQRPEGWDSPQWMHSLACFYSTSWICSSTARLGEWGTCTTLPRRTQTFKSHKSTLDFPLHKFWIQATETLTFTLRKSAMPWQSVPDSFRVSSYLF